MADPAARETHRELAIADERPPRGGGERSFAFADWANEAVFEYPSRAKALVERAGSPAEAYFLRGLADMPGVLFSDDSAHYRGIKISAQVKCGRFTLDAVAEKSYCRLAVEIDGAHHHETPKQISDDYYRARRIQYCGFVVVRFTASEVMRNPRASWRSVFEILDVQLRLPMHADDARQIPKPKGA